MSESIFEKIDVFNETNENIKTNIKFLYAFRNCLKKINVILVTNEDAVYCYGDNRCGVLGFGHKKVVNELTLNEELSNKQLIDFKNGLCHTIARDIDGKLYCWGNNKYLGNGRKDEEISKPELNEYLISENIVDMCCGTEHTVVLTSNNQVYTWGENILPETGSVSNNYISIPSEVNEFEEAKVQSISCGSMHSMAMTESGRVFSWGFNYDGQLGLNNGFNNENKPKRIEIEVDIKKISCGLRHSLLLTCKGDIYVFGWNKYKQLGLEINSNSRFKGDFGLETNGYNELTPIKLNHTKKFIEIASHPHYNILAALSENGLYYVWGEWVKEEIISEPKETQFKSFNEIFIYCCGITIDTINRLEECLINLFSLTNQKYKQNFCEIESISSGSFGRVFKVSEILNSNKIFAIKKIPLNRPLNDDQKEKLIKECKILTKMNNNYVVKCFNFWIEENYCLKLDSDSTKNVSDSQSSNLGSYAFDTYKPLLFHIQMELCYKTLKETMEIMNKELNSEEIRENNTLKYYISSQIFKELVESLNYLHRQNPPIIHRDLKPANILISYGSDGRFVKLADFGYAVCHEYDNQLHTQDKGTINYIAPEVDTRHYDTKSDVYSLSDKYVAPEIRESRNYGKEADIYSLGVITAELFNIIDDKFSGNRDSKIKIIELISSMTSYMASSRLNCDQILKFFLWEMNVKQLVDEKIIELKGMGNSIEESFHLYFIQKKWIIYEKTKYNNEYNIGVRKKYDLKFDDLEVIAFGNFSVVYKALDRSKDRVYAIKKVAINEHWKEKALKEIDILSKLKSEIIVKLEDFWIEDNYYHGNKASIEYIHPNHELFKKNNTLLLHIQMELCYKTLSEIIEIVNKELNQKESEVMSPLGYYISSELFIEILESVDYLHKQNIIHRDLKPSNILITRGTKGCFVKVADFGLATIHDFDGQSHSKYSGTPIYRAPEVSQTKRYDKKADIYSLGIIAPKLFNIDINEPIGEKSCLKSEYSNLFDLTERMSSLPVSKRPDCEKILREKGLWSLSLTKLMKLTDLKMIANVKPIEEIFHMFFIEQKILNHVLE